MTNQYFIGCIVTFVLYLMFQYLLIITLYPGCTANLDLSILGCIKMKILQIMYIGSHWQNANCGGPEQQKAGVVFFAVAVGKKRNYTVYNLYHFISISFLYFSLLMSFDHQQDLLKQLEEFPFGAAGAFSSSYTFQLESGLRRQAFHAGCTKEIHFVI